MWAVAICQQIVNLILWHTTKSDFRHNTTAEEYSMGSNFEKGKPNQFSYDFIKSDKKNKFCRQGVPSQARLAIEKDEFKNVLAKLNTFKDFKRQYYMILTACKFQFALIARIDDTCNFKETRGLKTQSSLL